jgi:phosphoglycolate phosphatase
MPGKISADLIVFDLDGTLVDSLPDLAAAANHACRALGLPEHPAAVIRQMIGGGEKTFVRRFIGEEHQDLFEEALGLYLAHYTDHCSDRTRPYPGVKETLAALAAVKRLAVLSNKMERLSRRVVQLMGLEPLFAAVKGGDSYGVLKPGPQGLAALIKELGAAPERTLMVGDKPADILAGQSAGARTLAVTYGYGEAASLLAAGPDALVGAFPLIQDVLDLAKPS